MSSVVTNEIISDLPCSCVGAANYMSRLEAVRGDQDRL